MKKGFVAALTIALLLGCVLVASAAPTAIRTKVPFQFRAGQALLPAGEYVFQLGGYTGADFNVVVKPADGSYSYYLEIIPGGSFNQRTPDPCLTFVMVGKEHVLSKIRSGSYEIWLYNPAPNGTPLASVRK
jgi:hypothetical protein